MSSIYNLEPQPTASLILHTTQGELSVELFAKQTPLTSRNFLQLCVDGYYDGTVFHRLVPGFIVQGGDPTGTGNGGESIYDGGAYAGDLDAWPMDQRRGRNAGPRGVNFKDEFHSRLKFNRRGLLGMANEGVPDSNGSQFFFTLDKTDELNGKNTLFGRVVGDTIYNLARLGEAELVDGTERPRYPIRITRVEILVNPFDDVRRRERVATQPTPAAAQPPKKKNKNKQKQKAGKKLLSFGDDVDDGGDDDGAPVIKKAKFDTRIVMEEEEDEAPAPKTQKSSHTRKEEKDSSLKKSIPVREPAPNTTREPERRSPPPPPPLRTKEIPKANPSAAAAAADNNDDDNDDEHAPSPSPEPAKRKSALERANEEIAAVKASMRRTIMDAEAEAAAGRETRKTALEQLIPSTSTRGRKRRRPGGDGDGDGALSTSKDLSAFEAFRSKLAATAARAPLDDVSGKNNNKNKNDMTSPSAGREGEDADGDDERRRRTDEKEARTGGEDDEAALCDLHFIANCQSCRSWGNEEASGGGGGGDGDVEDDDGGDAKGAWLAHRLSFAADKLGKDLSYRKKAEEELVVIDPREKARTLREERQARLGRGDGDAGGREWDRQAADMARNRKLARASALAGRGAR